MSSEIGNTEHRSDCVLLMWDALLRSDCNDQRDSEARGARICHDASRDNAGSPTDAMAWDSYGGLDPRNLFQMDGMGSKRFPFEDTQRSKFLASNETPGLT